MINNKIQEHKCYFLYIIRYFQAVFFLILFQNEDEKIHVTFNDRQTKTFQKQIIKEENILI